MGNGSVAKTILEDIGSTPLVELQRLGQETGVRLLVKVESPRAV